MAKQFRALALIDLTASGDDGPALGAMKNPAAMASLLHDLVMRPDMSALADAVAVAATTLADPAELATAMV